LLGTQNFSTLDEWLAWLETLHPKKIDLSLNRIRTVIEALDLAKPAYRIVTIGGTNGKGSCVGYLENIYRAARFRVGAFTSPHLWRFNERIRVDGRWASDAELIALFEVMERARGAVTLSYFESSAVAAFLHFANSEVDVALLEVGMGGRLDAVNVYDADAALIASIGLDHQEWLGQDRETIAIEKAGIMRAGRPVVVADMDPPKALEQAARSIGAAAYFIGRDFDFEPLEAGFRYREATGTTYELPTPGFGGPEQLRNAAACVRIVDSLQAELPVSVEAIRAGIATTVPAGRLDRRVIDGIEWVFDVAHNPAAVERFVEFVATLPAAPRTTAVFGAMKDKDLAAVLRPCVGLVDSWSVAPVASERSASVAQLVENLSSLGATAVASFDDVETACAAASAGAESGERVLVFGSFYTVGPAMASLGLYSDTSLST
jgi:dihydrofolate synthase/folylpolyglutamate synthase